MYAVFNVSGVFWEFVEHYFRFFIYFMVFLFIIKFITQFIGLL